MLHKPGIFPAFRVRWTNLGVQVARDTVVDIQFTKRTGRTFFLSTGYQGDCLAILGMFHSITIIILNNPQIIPTVASSGCLLSPFDTIPVDCESAGGFLNDRIFWSYFVHFLPQTWN